jgi:hypothetical protein
MFDINPWELFKALVLFQWVDDWKGMSLYEKIINILFYPIAVIVLGLYLLIMVTVITISDFRKRGKK